ncbi:MAG: hypothetical protein ACTSYR_03310 [Candidatus Odinarchaeia archaeon]
MEIKIKPEVLEKIFQVSINSEVELAGFLIGKQEGNTIKVINVLIPECRATSTSVSIDFKKQLDILNEINMEKGEIICGWFHTHPGLGADFLSPTDIQTQTSYQALFENSIAIVVDPLRFKKSKLVDDKVISVFKLVNGEPKKLRFKLDISSYEVIQNYFESKLKEKIPLTQEVETSDKIFITIEEFKSYRKQLLVTLLGWNFLVSIILASILIVLMIIK